jgi:two-component sensor histidine kinase
MTDDLGLGDRVNILLVDDQPGKLMSYELILQDLDQNLLKANSAKQALELLLKNEVAVILVDVCMPDLDGFELAQMIREHPRFKDTAIIFISAINITEMDSLKGYELGAVDYVSVPVVPGVLRAKVRVFVDLHLKTRALARMNGQLEQRVAERTAELEAATERQELLAREVDHRARNALTVIQSIVTLTPMDDSALYAEAIKGRIRAMATAHNLLAQSRWRGADLLTLMNEELAPYEREGRVSINGAAVSIAPSVAQNLALALHELATNAAKYGALSHHDGKLSVAWTMDEEDLSMDWREDCAHAVEPPTTRSFGFKVIDASIKAQLGGRVHREWRDNGLLCRLTLPLHHFKSAPASEAGPRAEVAETIGDVNKVKNRRILVLEDEPLIAMMTSQLIRDMDGVVLGPFANSRSAEEALASDVDVALLDVNIAGEFVYSLADRLTTRGIPIIFVTGYHASAIEGRFAHAPVLTKPFERQDLASALARAVTVRA